MKSYFVYLLSNRNRNVLYCGITNDLSRRIAEHQAGMSAFTKRYLVHHLVWCEEFSDVFAAISAEKRIKSMRRREKFGLIESRNPKWEFLEQQ
jgi:putative endonuclease